MVQNIENINEQFKGLADIIEGLKTAGVIRSRKWESDIGEWLVATLCGGKRADNANQKGWDVSVGDLKLQVKCSFEPDDNANQYTQSVPHEGDFAEVAIIVITDKPKVRRFFRIGKEKLKEILSNNNLYWARISGYKVQRGNIGQEHHSLLDEQYNL